MVLTSSHAVCRDTLVFSGPTGAAANAGPVAGDSFGLAMDKENQTEGLITLW